MLATLPSGKEAILKCASFLTRVRHQMCETEDMDWELVAQQFLRALRAQRSQRAFSRRLRYRSNVACDWEAGRRFPTACRTLQGCELLRIPVRAAFAAFQVACAPALEQGKTFAVGAWLDALRGSTTVAALAQRSGYSRYAITRWLTGRAEPRLPSFLALVEAITGRVSDLVQALVPIEKIPALLPAHSRRMAAKRVAFDQPWTEAVLRVIETVAYQRLPTHRPGYIAQRLGISRQQEELALQKLEDAGILEKTGGRYRDVQPLSVDTAAPLLDLQRLKEHWARVCLERLPKPLPQDWLGYNVISVADSDLDRIREVLRMAFREIRTIAAASAPVQTVALLNLQLISWPEAG
jgi:transcriptional regulator with XRE-family HTH domain